MKLSFTELAIDSREFNGLQYSLAKALIINRACDYIMHYLYPHRREDDVIPYSDLADVDFVQQIVNVPVSVAPEFH